jgi:hypothetical protein
MQDLDILNECRTMFCVLDFTPGEETIGLWANQAYLDMTGQTLEEYQRTIVASKISVAVANLNLKLHETIQVNQRGERVSKILYPRGKAVTLEFWMRPVNLVCHGNERTVILSSVNSLQQDQAKDKTCLLEEMLRYTHVTQVMMVLSWDPRGPL